MTASAIPAEPPAPAPAAGNASAGEAAALHAAGVAANADMRPADAAASLRQALSVLDAAGEHRSVLRGRILLSLALAESEQGHVDTGLQLLADAEQLLPPGHRGTLHGQRAMLLRRTGRDDQALTSYGHALAELSEHDEPEEVARVLLNRAVLHMAASRPSAARADLLRCAAIADRHGYPRLAAKSVHNLGYLDYLAGDLPAALGRYADAAHRYATILPGMLAVLSLDRARALLAAGLHTDADAELAAAQHRLADQRLSQDHAETHLARADAALLAGQPQAAIGWAEAARDLFRRRDNPRWTARADLAALRATFEASADPAGLAQHAVALREHLAALPLPEDARLAGLLAARAYAAAGDLDRAAGQLATCTPRRLDRLDTRLLWHLARADTAPARTAARHLTAGLSALHRAREQLGVPDLRTGVAVHGRELAHRGLRAALHTGRPADIFRWAERARAQALLLPPVRPPDDPRAAAALAELRGVRQSMRDRELAGHPLGNLPARADALQRVLREHAWATAADGHSVAPPVSLSGVRALLGTAAMVSYLPGERLRALVVTSRTARVVDLAPPGQATEALLRLRADLDAQAGRALPDRLATALAAATARDSAALAAAVLDPLLPLLGDAEVIVVPTGALMAVPWSVLPGLAGRPVTVAPSATAWAAARARSARAGPVALVCGPGNERGEPEVAEIAARYPGARVLVGGRATAEATLAAADGASLVHIAAHGHHDTDNPLFSRLDLADGPLFGYDLQRLVAPPATVVLSSCDIGMHHIRPGDEALGMAAALVGAGTRTVVASVCRVPDEDAMPVMATFHRLLTSGWAAANALATAVPPGMRSGFICFGAG
ncbi:CHAT domain-containing protein [Catellatospora sp. NPDC049133]|uniref:CHAT domain-containing protein n=1 Tax=Catellatospora sp. NPDC049133 TaxID=3155499 RepID=UPI0033E03272